MKRIVLIIEYDGTSYVGWQIQPNGIAVQQVIGNALKSITGEISLSMPPAARTAAFTRGRRQRILIPKAEFPPKNSHLH